MRHHRQQKVCCRKVRLLILLPLPRPHLQQLRQAIVQVSITPPQTPIDIGVVIGKIRSAEHVSDFELRQCLENRWSPTTKEQFPFSMKGPERRYLNTNHIQNYSWLAVS